MGLLQGAGKKKIVSDSLGEKMKAIGGWGGSCLIRDRFRFRFFFCFYF